MIHYCHSVCGLDWTDWWLIKTKQPHPFRGFIWSLSSHLFGKLRFERPNIESSSSQCSFFTVSEAAGILSHHPLVFAPGVRRRLETLRGLVDRTQRQASGRRGHPAVDGEGSWVWRNGLKVTERKQWIKYREVEVVSNVYSWDRMRKAHVTQLLHELPISLFHSAPSQISAPYSVRRTPLKLSCIINLISGGRFGYVCYVVHSEGRAVLTRLKLLLQMEAVDLAPTGREDGWDRPVNIIRTHNLDQLLMTDAAYRLTSLHTV